MPTAMIVDDNATLVYFTARNLEKGIDGLVVLTAASCEEARTVAEKHAPSVLIADIRLTDGSGIDLVDEMLERFPDMSAILISGVPPEKSLRDDLFGFLLKPYETEELLELVTRALKRVKSPRQTPEPVHGPPCYGYDHHKLCNQLGELIAGLRAFGKDLKDRAEDPAGIHRTVEQYLDRLCSTVMEVSNSLPRCPKNGERGPMKQE